MTTDVPDAPTPPGLALVLDALDPESLAEFWSAALRYRRADRVEQYVVLVPPAGHAGSVLLVQGVDDPKQVKNRMHLDLHVPDPEAEAERLVGLGATRRGEGSLGEIRWIAMADPEGNEFDLASD